jgi:hypothetical protein
MDITEAQKQFINLMWDNLRLAYQRVYPTPKFVISSADLRDYVAIVLPTMPMETNDRIYQIAPWDSWKNIIQFDWTDRKKYISDIYDCDNFSDSFRAHMAEIFELNSAGQFSCAVTSDDKSLVGMPHRAVLIVALDENNKHAVYAYESQTGHFAKVVKGQPIKIDSWTYTPSYSRWN